MVEMIETASILNNLSNRSLVLLDEIGRGTSTNDGVSIAWAIAEYLHEHEKSHPKTLFATHYHELNELASSMNRIKNYNVSIKEVKNKVVFLRKLVPGGSEHSFGIHVAKMAGMPRSVTERAGQIMKHLEKTHAHPEKTKSLAREKETSSLEYQLSIFPSADPKAEEIKNKIETAEIDEMTPLEAMLFLYELKKSLK